MNSLLAPTKCLVPLALTWTHASRSYRLTPWPELRVEARYGTEWLPLAAGPEVLAAAAAVGRASWRAFLEFVPADVRELVGLFRANRVLVLQVASRCPELVGVLLETPALAAYVAAQAQPRGLAVVRWNEANAVFERAGVFGLLEWLGLPASKPTLAVLRNLVSADLPPSLLEPLRAKLWKPDGLVALAQRPEITERDLRDDCALAA